MAGAPTMDSLRDVGFRSHANIRRSPFGSGIGSPNSCAVSIHRSMAWLMCANAFSLAVTVSGAPGEFGSFGHKGAVFVAPIDNNLVLVHQSSTSDGCLRII